jgi:hypothetical protein
MRLIKLRVAGVRGFNEEQTLDFDAKLVIYSGPNAGGKTSIGEAIEWLLYGKTLKRIKGDEISKREYAGSYRNIHYHGNTDPFVEAEIFDGLGKKRVLQRELDIDESSRLRIDGSPAADLRSLGIGAMYDRPLILQHTLQDFIFMRPKTRYEVLSAMLGLEALVELRNAVESAKTEFQNRLPARAANARHRTGLLLAEFRTSALLQPVVRTIEQGNLNEAHKHLVQVALGRATPGTVEDELIASLSQVKAAKERARLDWGRYSLNPIPRPDTHPAISTLQQLKSLAETFATRVGEITRELEKPPGQERPSPILTQFYQQGLKFVDAQKPNLCPFCLQDTLTPERLADLRNAVEPVQEAKKPLASALDSIDSLQYAFTGALSQVAKLIPSIPMDEERRTIEGLSQDAFATRTAYFSSCDAMSEISAELQKAKADLEHVINKTREALRDGIAPPEHVPSIGTAVESYTEIASRLPAVSNGYAASYAGLDPTIRNKLSSEGDVLFLGTLIQGLQHWPDVQIAHAINATSDGMQELIRKIREFVEIKQKQILGLRDQEIKVWYHLLTGGAQVRYDGMTPGTDNLELGARSFAKVMMAAPNLSSSQLNCIGLSVYIATCCRKGSPFQMVLFDDPIQSMDDEHTESFKKNAIGELLSKGFQVILLTHMDNFAGDVDRLYRQQQPLFYRLEPYSLAGPVVNWKGPEIKKLLNEVRKNKDAANEGFRKQATLALRQFVERLVKDLFMAETSQTISRKFEDKSWTDLRQILRQCKKFDATDEPELEDTHNFTSPYCHTDENLPQKAPLPHLINPHYNSMERLLKKYSGLLNLD